MTKLKLHTPTENELKYRRHLVADEKTMAYNAPYGENGTGCYYKTITQVKEWYKNWNNETTNFYAYIKINEIDIPIGEVSIHYSEYYNKHIVGIIIENCYRGKGYAKTALKLLIDYAFYKLGLDEIADDIPIDRKNADKLFLDVGFTRVNEKFVVLKKTDYEIKQISDSIAPCGLVCRLCHFADSCSGCKSNINCCGSRNSDKGCYQYNCNKEKGIEGCWECDISPCDKGMFSDLKDIRLRAFIIYIKQHGKDKLADRLFNNELKGIHYGHGKDYDGLGSIEKVLKRIE